MGRLTGYGARTSRGGAVSIVNGREVAEAMNTITAELRKPANAELRSASKDIAARHLIPALEVSAAASDMKMAAAWTPTAKSDRMVTVNIGGRRPRLSGLKKGESRRVIGGLAWGSEYGPYPGADVNTYGHPRKSAGYWVTRAVERVLPKAKSEYEKALERIFRKYGGR